MKAMRLLQYGGQLVFDDVPTPTIARDEILVKVESTAVNHLDLVKASGAARQILPIDLPWVPGHEFSGIVEQVGSAVAAYVPGDAVFGANGTGAAYAEYLAVKPALIARKPSNLSFEEAASVPVAGQTAWQGIFTHGHLEKGQTILIHAGAGAVGAYAVQLASHAGELGIALFEREIFLTSDEEEEVGPLRRHFVEYGWVGYTGMSHYITTKMGIIGFMRGLANDVASDGITANSVLPGLTNTLAISPQFDEQKRDTWNQQAIKRLGEPGDVTGAVLFLTSDDAAFITGQAIVVDGGQYRIG